MASQAGSHSFTGYMQAAWSNSFYFEECSIVIHIVVLQCTAVLGVSSLHCVQLTLLCVEMVSGTHALLILYQYYTFYMFQTNIYQPLRHSVHVSVCAWTQKYCFKFNHLCLHRVNLFLLMRRNICNSKVQRFSCPSQCKKCFEFCISGHMSMQRNV